MRDRLDRITSLERVRELCLALPETNERPSHGHPAFAKSLVKAVLGD